MTAILGYANGEHVWIGGDSRACNGWEIATLTSRKVFRVGDFLIGGSGVLRHVELLRLRLQVPTRPPYTDGEHYVCVHLMDAITDCWKAAGVAVGEEVDGATTALLVGYRGVLYHVDPLLTANACREQVNALGSGGDVAFGAFIALHFGSSLAVDVAMVRGLDIAAKYNGSVAPPFYVEQI